MKTQNEALALAKQLARDWANKCQHRTKSAVAMDDDYCWSAVWFEDEDSKTPDASVRFRPIKSSNDRWAVREEYDEQPWNDQIWIDECTVFACSSDAD